MPVLCVCTVSLPVRPYENGSATPAKFSLQDSDFLDESDTYEGGDRRRWTDPRLTRPSERLCMTAMLLICMHGTVRNDITWHMYPQCNFRRSMHIANGANYEAFLVHNCP